MIEYGNYVTPEEYMELRKLVGWTEFPLEEAKAGLDNAYMVTSVRDDGKAIGLLRLLWDGGYIAFISDVIVHPDYQGQGIGRKLVEGCIQRVKDDMKPGYKVKINLMAAKGKDTSKFGQGCCSSAEEAAADKIMADKEAGKEAKG